jgi:hypothetical protein
MFFSIDMMISKKKTCVVIFWSNNFCTQNVFFKNTNWFFKTQTVFFQKHKLFFLRPKLFFSENTIWFFKTHTGFFHSQNDSNGYNHFGGKDLMGHVDGLILMSAHKCWCQIMLPCMSWCIIHDMGPWSELPQSLGQCVYPKMCACIHKCYHHGHFVLPSTHTPVLP